MSVRSLLRGRSPTALVGIMMLAFLIVLGLIFLATWGVTGDWQVAYCGATATGIWIMLLMLVGVVVAGILHKWRRMRRL